jgi:hypothetical protein
MLEVGIHKVSVMKVGYVCVGSDWASQAKICIESHIFRKEISVQIHFDWKTTKKIR